MIQPTYDLILVEIEPDGETMRGGIIVSRKPEEDQVAQGTVIRCGPGRKKDKFDPDTDPEGPYIPMPVKEGDQVLVAKASGLSIHVDGKKMKLMPVTQVLGIVVE
jgi:co-chaperonin GroES (HSP10)